MKRKFERTVFLVIILLLSVAGCDEVDFKENGKKEVNNVGINFSTSDWIQLAALLTTLGFASGALRQIPTPKERMQRKILKELNKATNKGYNLVAEIKVRDAIYADYLWNSPLFKERFFTIFTECIRELFNNEAIIRANGGDLFSEYKLYPKEKRVSPFPPYNSCMSITPNKYYSLAKDNPNMYIGLNTKECQKEIETWEKDAQHRLKEVSKQL